MIRGTPRLIIIHYAVCLPYGNFVWCFLFFHTDDGVASRKEEFWPLEIVFSKQTRIILDICEGGQHDGLGRLWRTGWRTCFRDGFTWASRLRRDFCLSCDLNSVVWAIFLEYSFDSCVPVMGDDKGLKELEDQCLMPLTPWVRSRETKILTFLKWMVCLVTWDFYYLHLKIHKKTQKWFLLFILRSTNNQFHRSLIA